MQYQGGKARSGKWIVELIAKNGAIGPFWEPFCGGLGASVCLAAKFGAGLHSDGNLALASMYSAVYRGWLPPSAVSEADYQAARELPDSDPLKAFTAVACSFGGKWFGGYARDRGVRDYCAQGRRAVLRDVPQLTEVFYADFLQSTPEAGLGFLYCDPPYGGTTQYSGAPKFDADRFWAVAAAWSKFCPVFVSEYAAPFGWIEIGAREQNTGLGGGKLRAVERLFQLGVRPPVGD